MNRFMVLGVLLETVWGCALLVGDPDCRSNDDCRYLGGYCNGSHRCTDQDPDGGVASSSSGKTDSSSAGTSTSASQGSSSSSAHPGSSSAADSSSALATSSSSAPTTSSSAVQSSSSAPSTSSSAVQSSSSAPTTSSSAAAESSSSATSLTSSSSGTAVSLCYRPAYGSPADAGEDFRPVASPSLAGAAGVAVADGMVFATVANKTVVYDPTSDTWQVLPDHNFQAANICRGFTLRGSAYFSCADEGNTAAKTHLSHWDNHACQWVSEATDTVWRASCGVVLDGKAYLFGYYNTVNQNQGVVRVFDPDAGWSGATPGTFQQDKPACVAVDDSIWLLGGNSGGSYSADVYRYVPGDGGFFRVTPLPTAVMGATAVLCGRTLHVMGGAVSGGHDGGPPPGFAFNVDQLDGGFWVTETSIQVDRAFAQAVRTSQGVMLVSGSRLSDWSGVNSAEVGLSSCALP